MTTGHGIFVCEVCDKIMYQCRCPGPHERMRGGKCDACKAAPSPVQGEPSAPSPAHPDGGFCTECGHAFPSFEGLTGCPACGTKNSPCANTEQVSISINWHELRILVMWAENWQRRISGSRVVYSIAKRIAAQHPGKIALTLAGELGEVAQKFPGMQVSDPKLRQDIAEQTGQEPGIIPPAEDQP